MPADDRTQCLPFSQIFNALEFYEFSIATNREDILFIQNIGNTRGHTSSKVLSGFAENDKTQKAIKEGALGLLQKPFTTSELLSRIDRVLARR